jgi:hypothetical protein
MHKLATGLALGGVVLALAACTKGSVPTGGAAAPDAGLAAGSAGDASGGSASAGAALYSGPFEAHVVARMLSSRTALVPLADGKVVLEAGLFRYALNADGTAKRIGELSDYATKMPADDSQLGGYDVEPIAPAEPVAGAPPWHDLRGPLDGRRRLEGWARSDDIDVPPDVQGEDLRRAADGTTVLLTRDSKSETYVTFVAAPNSRQATRVPIDGLDPVRRDVVCEQVPSWARPHLICRSWRDGVTSVHRLAGERWEVVPIAEENAQRLRVGAVGPDGALWLGLPAGRVLRIAANGAAETFDMPKADPALARPSYSSMETYVRLTGGAKTKPEHALFGEEGLHRWQRIGITVGTAGEAFSYIRQIVPRADGEAWVLTSESRGGHVLVHMSRPAMAPLADALAVGTDADQRNEVRNLKEPVTWVAHCPQLFVTLAKQRADGSLASESVWSREPQIAEIVKKVAGKPRAEAPSSRIVEGRLGGRRVAGVLVWRSEPAASEELLENTATAVAAELSPMTGATPHITCTAPVLERASASLL